MGDSGETLSKQVLLLLPDRMSVQDENLWKPTLPTTNHHSGMKISIYLYQALVSSGEGD